MSNDEIVAEHYAHGTLLDAIVAGMQKMGKDRHCVVAADFSGTDEFHIGGRAATEAGPRDSLPSGSVATFGASIWLQSILPPRGF